MDDSDAGKLLYQFLDRGDALYKGKVVLPISVADIGHKFIKLSLWPYNRNGNHIVLIFGSNGLFDSYELTCPCSCKD